MLSLVHNHQSEPSKIELAEYDRDASHKFVGQLHLSEKVHTRLTDSILLPFVLKTHKQADQIVVSNYQDLSTIDTDEINQK
jgi:hypothetical protein